jgi:allophanate hydrolase
MMHENIPRVSPPGNLLIADLREHYRAGRLRPAQLIDHLLQAADAAPSRNVWIRRLSRTEVMAYVLAVERRGIEDQPLYGVPFVIKDNIDLAGVPTTAACPDFSYIAQRSATVVQRLLDAGAIPLGKTNLDQFATGLVGARSPYGACRNSFNDAFISGGSSAGSAVAVATGIASFSLGTDTAGSGRVPAAFNNILGLKPSLGRLSTQGVVPACRSIDCVSIFALTAEDAESVLDVTEGFDASDPYSRPLRDQGVSGMRFGVPRADQLQFFGDQDYAQAFVNAQSCLERLGGTRVEIDFAPFLEAGRLLYEGPWLAERYAAIGATLEARPEAVLPVTRRIIEAAKSGSAIAAFQGQYRLMALKRAGEQAFARVDFIVTPTAPTIYSIAAVEADPVRLNANLGYYTNFMNLLDLAGVAVPGGFRADGLPFGVTLVGPGGSDRGLLKIASRLHRAGVGTLGALNLALPAARAPAPRDAACAALRAGYLSIAVCGAHMNGLPLNHQLRERGAYLLRSTRTSPSYRFFALSGGPPHRPGLVRVADGGGAIELEVWAMPAEHVGAFVAAIPAPLGIGTLELEDGSLTLGFICESHATRGAADITAYGGWRAFQQRNIPA